MLKRLDLERFVEIIRYYQAGIINIAFGFALYSLFVFIGFDIYAAQICSHFIGVAFNYFTYSKHVFRDAGPAKARFFLSYVVNYLASLAALAVAIRLINSPYIAGFMATIIVSIANFFVLKFLVFSKKTQL